MPEVLLDVTDLVEFLQRQESVSGVQRVIAETAPVMLAADPSITPVLLDRTRGELVPLTNAEVDALLRTGAGSGNQAPERGAIAAAASAAIDRARGATPASVDSGTVVVFLGAVWINDALMLAARRAHAAGARCLYLLYDLTPVLQTGHTAAVNRLFERYLLLVTETGSTVPAISASSRRDYEAYCADRGWQAPDGGVTGLPCGLAPGQFDTSEPPWPRPYALFVGTVESRKNHALALAAWQRLIETAGGRAGARPRLHRSTRLARGRLPGRLRPHPWPDGKVSVLSSSVPDADLAAFYAHADFTVYPSRYEGWGLPVSESLAFGRLPVVADNSSLPEAGRDLAAYFASDDVDDFVRVLEAEALDPEARARHEDRIAADTTPPITWQQVATVIMDEVARVADDGRQDAGVPPDRARPRVHAGGGLAGAGQRLRRPVPRAPAGRGPDPDAAPAARGAGLRDRGQAVIGAVGSPQAWGYELRPGPQRRHPGHPPGRRPARGPARHPGDARGGAHRRRRPRGPVSEQVYLGSVVTLPLGDGQAGEPAQVTLTVTDAHDSVEGFLGIRSLVVLRADDLTAQVVAHKSAADALRQELDFVMGTRSWKVTAPLRKWKGRGA